MVMIRYLAVSGMACDFCDARVDWNGLTHHAILFDDRFADPGYLRVELDVASLVLCHHFDHLLTLGR